MNPADPAANPGGTANAASQGQAGAAAAQLRAAVQAAAADTAAGAASDGNSAALPAAQRAAGAAGAGSTAGAASAAGSATLQVPYSTMKVVYPLGKATQFGGRRPYYRFTHARLYKKTLTLFVDPLVKQPLTALEAKKGFFVSLTALSTADTGLNVRIKRYGVICVSPLCGL